MFHLHAQLQNRGKSYFSKILTIQTISCYIVTALHPKPFCMQHNRASLWTLAYIPLFCYPQEIDEHMNGITHHHVLEELYKK